MYTPQEIRLLPPRPKVMQFVKLFVATLFACALLLPRASARANELQVCFSPPLLGACDPMQTVVQAVNSAQHQVLVQAYSFPSAPIAKAVSDAKKRGLDVRVILDKSNARKGYSAATFLDHAGVPVLIDSSHAIAHKQGLDRGRADSDYR